MASSKRAGGSKDRGRRRYNAQSSDSARPATHEEVHQALHAFLRRGQSIRDLPDEPEPPRSRVGEHHGAYEPIFRHG